MATAKKSATKKVASKKTAAGKTAAKKAPLKTASAKKVPAKKTAAKKATPKKVTAKKVVAKKAATKAALKKTTAKSASRKSTARKVTGPMDAVRLLTEDHREAHALFEQYKTLVESEAEGAERQSLAMQICEALTAHTTIEEEIFYPAARDALDEEDLLDEAEVEHASAKELIAQIRAMGPDDDLYDAKVTVLGEYVDHHVEEEETEMFPKCRRAKMDLVALAGRLGERKSQLLDQSAAAMPTSLSVS